MCLDESYLFVGCVVFEDWFYWMLFCFGGFVNSVASFIIQIYVFADRLCFTLLVCSCCICNLVCVVCLYGFRYRWVLLVCLVGLVFGFWISLFGLVWVFVWGICWFVRFRFLVYWFVI